MAKKVRCPQCGAKNALDSRRCRVCTTILNPQVPEPAAPLGLGEAELGAAASSRVAPEPSAPSPAEVVPTAAGPEPAVGSIETYSAPGPEAPVSDAAGFDPVDGADGIVIDALPRNPEAPPPPLEFGGDEPFDPDGLIIDPPR